MNISAVIGESKGGGVLPVRSSRPVHHTPAASGGAPTQIAQPQDLLELSGMYEGSGVVAPREAGAALSAERIRLIQERIAANFYNSENVSADISDKLTHLFDEMSD